MTALCFVDTNLLVYARDADEADKQPRAESWMRELWRTRNGRTSYQVLQEFYVTVTKKLTPGLPPELARSDVLALCAWRPSPADRQMLEGAWGIVDRYGLSFWDAMIVSAAQSQACRYLLTEDMQDGMEFGDLTVRNPFQAAPDQIP